MKNPYIKKDVASLIANAEKLEFAGDYTSALEELESLWKKEYPFIFPEYLDDEDLGDLQLRAGAVYGFYATKI